MKLLTGLLYFILLCVAALSAGFIVKRCWPYFTNRISEHKSDNRMEIARRSMRNIRSVVKPQRRFDNVEFFVWPMDGISLVFQGFVTNAQDLVDLKGIVDQTRGSTGVRWSISATNTIPTKR